MSLTGPPLGLWPLAFVGLIPLLWIVRTARPRRGALVGLVFGLTYFGTFLSWIMLFGKPAWAGLVIACAAYAAVFGALAPALWRGDHPGRSMAALAALWTVLEFLRGSWPLGGFTWGEAAYAQAGNPTLVPLASVTGARGVTFVVVLVNGLLLVFGERLLRRRVGEWRPAVLAASVAIGLVVAPVLIPIPQPNGGPVDVAAIQIDVPEVTDEVAEDRLIAERFAEAHRTFRRDPPDLAIWPENALDVDPTLDPLFGRLVTDAVRAGRTPTLIGAITGPADGTQFNGTLLYGPDGLLRDLYDKVHLVPFGEYAPARDLIGGFVKEVAMIRRDLTAGTEIDPIRMQGMTFGSVICYENAFSEIDRRLVADGSQFLVVSTNNANYGTSPASAQHLQISRLRAVENARWVVHAGLTGISGFIDPNGDVHDQTNLFEPEVIRRTITASTATTIYTRYGDWFTWLCAAGVIAAFLIPRRRRERGTAQPLSENARTLVILPTFNEAATIAEVLTRLLELPERLDILVVDDNSPDGTANIVRKEAAGGAPIRILDRPDKSGLASAYLQSFRIALDDGYDLVVEMDSDLSHQPEELPGLLAGARRAHLTIGSRYVPGGSVTNWGVFRRFLSRAGNLYARLCLGFPLNDATSGFRVYRREVLEAMLQEGVRSEGYGFQIELAYRSWLEGFAITEVPITFREREHGTSKISRRIVYEALWLVTKWGAKARLKPQPAEPDAE
ncbi:MAG: apolipoprotein N-acyltransferase [Actinomycetota bacterium]